MNELIVYALSCFECHNRHTLKRLRHEAAMIGKTVTVKRVVISKDLQDEARQRSSLPYPFIYNPDTGKSIALSHSLIDLL